MASILVLGASALALALVAHVWMFSTAHVEHGVEPTHATVAPTAPQAPLVATSCPSDMGGCEVVLGTGLFLLLGIGLAAPARPRPPSAAVEAVTDTPVDHLRGPPHSPVSAHVLILE